MPATVVILTKLPGHMPVKTRLRPVLGERGARAFYLDMLKRTIALWPDPVVAYSPPDADPVAALPGVGSCRFMPVEGGDGATCLENALAAAYEGRPLVALGGDAPDFARLDAVIAGLEASDAVFVPTGDGGFSCLGLNRPVPGLKGGFSYGSDDALRSLRAFLEGRGLETTCLEPWPDIDTPDDLEAYRRRQAEG